MASPKKYAGTMESWYKTWCPYCETSNWHCNGNESDLSGLDVEAVKCRSCGAVFLLGLPDEILDELRGEDYGYVTEDGVEMIKNEDGDETNTWH